MNTQAKPSSWTICFKRLTPNVIVIMVMLLLRSWPVQALGASISVKPDVYQPLTTSAQTPEGEKQVQPTASAEQLLEATQPVTSTAPAQVLILVAGQYISHDPVEPNIHHATNAVYQPSHFALSPLF